jgi:hypothetical protein
VFGKRDRFGRYGRSWKIESEIVRFWRLSHKVKWNMIDINEAIIHLIRWNGLVAMEFRIKWIQDPQE